MFLQSLRVRGELKRWRMYNRRAFKVMSRLKNETSHGEVSKPSNIVFATSFKSPLEKPEAYAQKEKKEKTP
jgi:hypothetical protein